MASLKKKKTGGILARGDDLDCSGGKANGNKKTNVWERLWKHPGDLITDWMWELEGVEESKMAWRCPSWKSGFEACPLKYYDAQTRWKIISA